MSLDRELAQRVCDYLNELVKLDRPCIGAMIANRIPCNEALADHPSCQVTGQHGGHHVGVLGLLNGFCGNYEDGPKKGWGAIAAVFDTDGPASNDRANLKGFCIIENKE